MRGGKIEIMTQTDGEKELVLGNKQLISLFFVVVALCGVFFALGYMIGRNTSKPLTANLENNAPVAAAAPPLCPMGIAGAGTAGRGTSARDGSGTDSAGQFRASARRRAAHTFDSNSGRA